MARARKIRTVAAIFGSALALAVAGCDGSDEDIPRRSAGELLATIDSIRSAVDDDRCDEAETEASNLTTAVNNLVNEDVPDDVVTSLQQGVTSLQSLIAERCGIETETTTTTTAETTTAADTTTTTTEETTTTTTTATEPEDDDEGEGEGDDEDTGGTGAGGTEAPGRDGGGGGGGATPRVPGLDGPAGGRR